MNDFGRREYDQMEFSELLARLASSDVEESGVREEILRRSTGLIDRIIDESFSRAGFARNDLFRPGYLGLLNAVYNFDLSRGKAFDEYAENLIKGEIRQHIRDQAQRPEIPLWLKDLNRQIEAAESRLLRELGRLPTLAELADAVNITEEGIAEVFKAREALSYVSLDVDQRRNDPEPRIDPTRIRSKRAVAFPIEHRIRIASALEKLAELQQYLFRHLFDSVDAP